MNAAITDIRVGLEALIAPGSVVELRIPKAGREGTISGYFSDLGKLAEAANGLSGRYPGIYFTMNPTRPELLARSTNRYRARADTTTADDGIERRRWLMLDLDPARFAAISSTHSEHELAIALGRGIVGFLQSQDWPLPVAQDSGNGAYLLYRIDEANDDSSRELIRRCLVAVAFRFDDGGVKVDQTTFNAARIIRIPGTLNRKGDDTPDRPHRLSRLIYIPNPIQVVTRDQLEALAALGPPGAEPGNGHAPAGFSLEEFIRQHLDVFREASWGSGGHKWVLRVCPFDSSHADHSAWVACRDSGAIVAGCQHDHCIWGWRELREKFEPGAQERRPFQRVAQVPQGDSSAHRAYDPNEPGDEADNPWVGLDTYSELQVVAVPWTTAAEIAADTPAEVDWLWEDYLALGTVVELDAKIKSGKTTLVGHLLLSILDGRPFLESK